MSKFDAERLTKEQLLSLARGEIQRAKIWDGDVALAYNYQAMLDAARVPEPKTAAALEKELVDYLLSARPSVCAGFLCELDLIRDAREREAGEG